MQEPTFIGLLRLFNTNSNVLYIRPFRWQDSIKNSLTLASLIRQFLNKNVQILKIITINTFQSSLHMQNYIAHMWVWACLCRHTSIATHTLKTKLSWIKDDSLGQTSSIRADAEFLKTSNNHATKWSNWCLPWKTIPQIQKEEWSQIKYWWQNIIPW